MTCWFCRTGHGGGHYRTVRDGKPLCNSCKQLLDGFSRWLKNPT